MGIGVGVAHDCVENIVREVQLEKRKFAMHEFGQVLEMSFVMSTLVDRDEDWWDRQGAEGRNRTRSKRSSSQFVGPIAMGP